VYKAGDVVPFRVRLLESGVPATYASKALFLAAGYDVLLDIGGEEVAATWDFVVINAAEGEHDILLTMQEGNGYLTTTSDEAAGKEAWPRTRPVCAEPYNIGSMIALITSTNGTPINQDRTSVSDFTLVEGDSLLREIVVPLAALNDWGYEDLSDSGWVLSAAARKRENRLAPSPDFVLAAYISDAVNRLVSLGMNPFATGAEIPAVASQESQTYLWDLQLSNTKSWAITAVNTGTKQFTVAGDRRKFFSLNTAPATSITVTGSNAGTYTVTAIAYTGGNTVLTVSQAIGSGTVDGNLSVPIKFTPNKGTISTGRQEDRT
jgi:hypothetical protein